MLGRCKSDEENAAILLITGLVIWGIYEYYDEEEYPQALFYNNNLPTYLFFHQKWNNYTLKTVFILTWIYSHLPTQEGSVSNPGPVVTAFTRCQPMIATLTFTVTFLLGGLCGYPYVLHTYICMIIVTKLIIF